MIRFSERFSGGSILKYIETMFFFPKTHDSTTHNSHGHITKTAPLEKTAPTPGSQPTVNVREKLRLAKTSLFDEGQNFSGQTNWDTSVVFGVAWSYFLVVNVVQNRWKIMDAKIHDMYM